MTGQLFSKESQAIFYNWKANPVQRMLDFDFLCGAQLPPPLDRLCARQRHPPSSAMRHCRPPHALRGVRGAAGQRGRLSESLLRARGGRHPRAGRRVGGGARIPARRHIHKLCQHGAARRQDCPAVSRHTLPASLQTCSRSIACLRSGARSSPAWRRCGSRPSAWWPSSRRACRRRTRRSS
jgi:hypothetical protein